MTDYGATDTSTTTLGTNQFPANAVFVPGDTKLTVVQGGPKGTDVNGKTYTPVAEYVPDGNDVAQGLTTDAAVTGDNAGTLSAKLRGLSKIFTDVWDSVNHRLHVNVDAGSITANAGTNLNTSALALEAGHLATIDSHIPAQGQALAAASVPVVLPATQITTLTPPAAITGFALEAGHLANIDTHTPAQGQATMANSRPVVIASNQTDLPVKGDFAEQSGLSAAALNADLVASTDVSAYKWLSLQLTPTAYVGTLSFQWSNDNANFYPLMLYRPDTASQTNAVTAITSVSSLGYYGPIGFRYLRVRMTAYTSGTANATLELYTVPPPVQLVAIAAIQTGTWTVQPGNTANTTPWLVNAQRNTVAVYSLASTVTTGSTQNSGDLAVGPYAELSIDITTTAQAGTLPTIQYFYERKAADGNYYPLWQSAVLTLAANTLSTSIGAGMAYNQSLGATGRLRWVVGGSATPTFTHSLNIQAK